MRNIFVFLAVSGLLAVSAVAVGEALMPVDASRVRLGGEIGRRIEVTVENNLLVLDLDNDFLKPFRDRKAGSGYVGLGKTIEAFVRLAHHTGNPELLERKQYLVRETLATQEADGYIGMMRPESRVFALWDIHEGAYLIPGLAMDHRFFGAAESLEGARKLADYFIAGWSAEPEREPGGGEIMPYMAYTGWEPALLALHAETGDAKYLEFCRNFREPAAWDGPIVLGRWGRIQGHAYAYLARCLAQLRLHRLDPDEALRGQSRKAMDFLLAGDGLSVTGTCGQHECWHDTQEGAVNLGETCATAYLLRWWDELMRAEPGPVYGDLMERAIHNALFAAQSPDGRKIRYYAPFEGPRVYFDGDTYCCPCNYRRILGELPAMVYYTSGDAVFVNLYTPSSAELTVAGAAVTVEQETDYPHAGRVAITLRPAASAPFTLALRVPGWCEGATVSVNGEPAGDAPRAGGFFRIARTWADGDRVELNLPMKPRLVAGRKAQAGRAVVMHGPLVFCLNRERNPGLDDTNLRLLTIDPATLSGPVPDDTAHPGGLACTVKAWHTTNWYPFAKHDVELTLTEFPDPGGEAAYFHVPDPNDAAVAPDPLLRYAGVAAD